MRWNYQPFNTMPGRCRAAKVALIAIAFTFFLTNCSVQKKMASAIAYKDRLVGQWVHAHEEDHDGVRVFRPATYSFKPSRGREKITLKEDGMLEYTPIAPNDLPQTFAGNWEIDRSKLILKYENQEKIYRIIQSTDSILKLK